MAGPVYGGQGVTGSLRGQPTNVYELKAGQVALIPAGTWFLQPGPYCSYQEYDIITGIWRSIGNDGVSDRYVRSDGSNFRVANQTGCVVGAWVTTAGSGYTSAPTVTDATTTATYKAILGPLVSSVTVNNGGSNYVYPPNVVFSAPPPGGVQATGYATISAGAVTTVTITDQGAGYSGGVPTVSFINDPRDTTGYGAAGTVVLTGAGVVAAVVVTDHGNPVASVPTLTFGSGSAAATAIMCWTIQAYTVSSSGTGYTGAVEVTGLGGASFSGAAYTNPTIQTNLVRTRKASIGAALATTFANITATGQTVYDGGIYTGTPSAIITTSAIVTTAATLGFTMGGANDVYKLMAA